MKENDIFETVDKQAFYYDMFEGGCATQVLWGLRGVVNDLFTREPLYKNELVNGEVVSKVYDEVWRLDINKLRSKYPHLTHLMDPKYDGIGNIAVTKNDAEETAISLSFMRIDAGEELLAGVIRKWEEELEKGGQLKINFK